MTPELVITALRNSIKDAEYLFANGKCFQLYVFLRSIWKNAECWYDGDHAVTVINGECYDIRGRIKKPLRAVRFEKHEKRQFKNAFRWDAKKIT